LGCLQQFVKEAGEYAGAHVHSMVRAHYPLINFKRFELGYPKEVSLKQADQLQIQLLDLSASIMGDINLCGTSSPPVGQEPASSSQLSGAAVSTSQSLALETSSVERSKAAVSTSQTPMAPASSAKEAPPSSSGEKAKSGAQLEHRAPTSQ
jgi:hypothetical protein